MGRTDISNDGTWLRAEGVQGEKQYDTNRIGTRYRGQRQYDTSVGDQMLPPGDEFACRFVGIAGRAACGDYRDGASDL